MEECRKSGVTRPEDPARTVQNFCRDLEVLMETAGEHFEYFTLQLFHTTSVIVI